MSVIGTFAFPSNRSNLLLGRSLIPVTVLLFISVTFLSVAFQVISRFYSKTSSPSFPGPEFKIANVAFSYRSGTPAETSR